MKHNGSLIPVAAELFGNPEALALRAGQINYNGPRQIYTPSPLIVCSNGGGEGGNSYTTILRIPTPDSRCRVKVSIVYVPADSNNPTDITGFTTVWIAGCDFDQRGVGGGGGRSLPVTNVEGTEAAPTAIPKAAGLLGYSREFVTAADCLEVSFTTATISGQGTWVLLTRLQPDAVTLDWKEWEQIRALFNPLNLGGQGAV